MMKGKMKKFAGVAALFLFLGTIAVTTIDCASQSGTNPGPSGPRGPGSGDDPQDQSPASGKDDTGQSGD